MLRRNLSEIHHIESYEYLQVTRGDVVPGNEGLLLVDNFVDTNVGVEVGLNVLEEDDRSISSSTSERHLQSVHFINIGSQSYPNVPVAWILGEIPMASWKELCKVDELEHTQLPFHPHLQTERFVDVFTTLAVVEEILLDIITDGEQRTASCVGDSVHSIGASDTFNNGRYEMVSISLWRG